MLKRWFLSQFFRDEDNVLRPVCAAYGSRWRCPMYPADPLTGCALVEMLTTSGQIDAAKTDPRIVVLGGMYTAIPSQVASAYAGHGATAGMTLGQLLDALADTEPIFAEEMARN